MEELNINLINNDYELLYNDLVKLAKLRGLEKGVYKEYLEIHHIIPRCLGGDDSDENLVLLTPKEHLLAHIILYELHPDCFGLLLTITMMIPSRTTWGTITEEEINEILSGREYKVVESNRKVDVVGSIEREQWKKKLSENATLLMSNPKRKEQISNTLKNKEDKTPLKKRSRKVVDDKGNVFESVASCAIFYGFKSGVSISNKIKQGTGQFRYLESKKESLKIKGPDGTIYSSLRECSKQTGHSRKIIRKWIKENPTKGFIIIN